MKRTNGPIRITFSKGSGKQEYTIEFIKYAIMLDIYLKNLDVVLKYIDGVYSHL